MMRSAKRLARSVALLARWVSDLPTSTVITVMVAALITAVVVWVTQFTVIYFLPWGIRDPVDVLRINVSPASAVQWSSNGSHIMSPHVDRDWFLSIYVSAADGSSVRHIHEYEYDQRYIHEYGDVSSDGSLLVYSTRRHYRSGDRGIMWQPEIPDPAPLGIAEIETSNLDGSDRRRLTRSMNYNLLPSWSPDGSKIAFAKYAGQLYLGIYVMNRDGSGMSRIAAPGPSYEKDLAEVEDREDTYLVRIRDASVMGPVWSPLGDELAFVVEERASHPLIGDSWSLYMVKPDGSQLRRLLRTSRTLDDSGVENGVTGKILSFPAWSPDGRTVAFIAFGRRGEVGAGYIFSVMSVGRDSPLREIVSFDDQLNGKVIDRAFWNPPTLEWSPNGSSIMFSVLSITGEDGLYRVDPDGSDLLKIAGGAPSAAFSPDGSRIAVAAQPSCEDCSYPAGTVLYTMTPDGSDVQALARRDGDGRLKAVNAPSGWLKRVWDAVTP